ncbi:MAG: hypothetical protein ABI175_17530 [Polyangiales bacterium]
MRRTWMLAIVTLLGCAPTGSVWPRARKPFVGTQTMNATPRLCVCPKKEGLAYLATMEVPASPPVLRRHIFGDFFVAETIDRLEAHYGAPLEITLEPLLAEFEPDVVALAKVRSTLVERLPAALTDATAALLAPSASVMRDLRRLRAEYDEAVIDGDTSATKQKRAELWRAYRAGVDLLFDVAAQALSDVLTHPYDFSPSPSKFVYERVAKESGIPELASYDILRAAGTLHARRRAVVTVAGPQLGALVEVHRPSLATYVTFP